MYNQLRITGMRHSRRASCLPERALNSYLMMYFLPELMYKPGAVGLALKMRPVMSNHRLLLSVGLSLSMVLIAVARLIYSIPAAASILP